MYNYYICREICLHSDTFFHLLDRLKGKLGNWGRLGYFVMPLFVFGVGGFDIKDTLTRRIIEVKARLEGGGVRETWVAAEFVE